MATKKDTFDFWRYGSKTPWDEWLDGSIWHLAHGVDYKSQDHSFRVALYNNAKELGVKVRTRKVSDGMVIQAYNLDGSKIDNLRITESPEVTIDDDR